MADMGDYAADTTGLLSNRDRDDHVAADDAISRLRRYRLAIVGGAALLLVGFAVGAATSSGRSDMESAGAGPVSLFAFPPLPFHLPSPPTLPFLQPKPAAPYGMRPGPNGMQAGMRPAGQPAIPEAQPTIGMASTTPEPPEGPEELNFYMYRAGGPSAYPLENVNTASLEGVMWYLHSEVVTSAPRKYGIDRIRRYEVRVKNTQEFWNKHKTNFGPFMAFDAGRCTTNDHGVDVCEEVFSHYGYIVGCQPLAATTAAYFADQQTTTACEPGTQQCNAPVWYSLPGECPAFGIPQNYIDANQENQNIGEFKSPTCRMQNPGGLCETATGAPDCTFQVWPAGEVYLNELIGIQDYNNWWNASYEDCITLVNSGYQTDPCEKNYEYVVESDAGVGATFWDERMDVEKGKARVDAVKALFQAKFPDQPADIPAPICDFDSIYDGEFQWEIDHTNAVPSDWWSYSGGGPVPALVQEKFNTPAPAPEWQPNPFEPNMPVPTPPPAPTPYADSYPEAVEQYPAEQGSAAYGYQASAAEYPATASGYQAAVIQQPEVPASQDQVPAAQYQAPEVQAQVPAAQYQAPEAQYPAPASQDQVPAAQYPAPEAQYPAPATQAAYQ